MANVQFLLGRSLTFIFSPPPLCLSPAPVPSLFVTVRLSSSLASCCYCSLMRPQSGQNYGGCGKVEEKSNEQLLDHKIFLFFVETASSLQKISRVGYHAGISAKMPTMYLPKSKRFSAPQNSVAPAPSSFSSFLNTKCMMPCNFVTALQKLCTYCATFFLSSTNTAARLSSGYIPRSTTLSCVSGVASDSSNPSGFHVLKFTDFLFDVGHKIRYLAQKVGVSDHFYSQRRNIHRLTHDKRR